VHGFDRRPAYEQLNNANNAGTLPAVSVELHPTTRRTKNLFWYQPPSNRKADTLSNETDLGIAADQFSDTIPITRINMQLMDRLSVNMKPCKSFRMIETQIINLGLTGTIIQEIETRSIPSDFNVRCTIDDIAATSIARESVANVGASHLMSLQFYKNMATNGADHTQNSLAWSSVTFTPPAIIPHARVINRNILLDLPVIDRFP